MEEKFFLQNRSAGYVGNSPLFWRAGGSGYTPWIGEAEQFSGEEADRIIRSTVGSHDFVKYPAGDIWSMAKHTVDVQDLTRYAARKNQ